VAFLEGRGWGGCGFPGSWVLAGSLGASMTFCRRSKPGISNLSETNASCSITQVIETKANYLQNIDIKFHIYTNI